MDVEPEPTKSNKRPKIARPQVDHMDIDHEQAAVAMDISRRSPKEHFPAYLAVPFNKQSVLESYQRISHPPHSTASPAGWHFVDSSTPNVLHTAGNNVISSPENKTMTQSLPNGAFNYKYDTTKDPGNSSEAANVNAFYIVNYYHVTIFLFLFSSQQY
jgi:extracellular elastinolytic metalloproteinase